MASKNYTVSKMNIVVAISLGGCLLLLNIFLFVQNRNLKVNSDGRNREIVLKEGKALLPLVGIDADEIKQTLDWGKDGRKTVVMIFSPQCGYCRENMPIWNEIISKADKSLFRIVAASSIAEGAKEFVEAYEFKGIPILIEPEPRSKVEYVMYLTPQTILVDQTGKIERVWIGPVQNEKKSEIETSLNIKLLNDLTSNPTYKF